MNETKFTLGPWHYDKENNAIYNKTCLYICDAPKNNDHDKHLITAAPELYEALNDLLNDCINFDGGKLTDIFMVKASRALAKARGEV